MRHEQPDSPDRFVRQREATLLLGVSASTLRRLERRRELPPRRAISPNTRGWLYSELAAFMAGRGLVPPKGGALR